MPKIKENKKNTIQYTYSFKVSRSDTLLNFLLGKMNLSRNSIKSLLSGHKVLINGQVSTRFDYPLAKDDEIKIAKNPVKQEIKSKDKTTDDFQIKKYIIYEDEYFIAINKPNGLLSVESDKERQSAYLYVENYLRSINPKARAYQLHRIDKETSGVLVFAKDIKVHSMLKMHWNDDIQLREYEAIIKGKMDKKKDTITSFLKENQNNLIYVSKDKNGKKAITHYEVIKETNDYSFLRVTIDTGRKNQIRVQMESLGHPIIGDNKYSDGQSPINRLGLHASRLDFINPITKELVSIKAPTPVEFKKLFK